MTPRQQRRAAEASRKNGKRGGRPRSRLPDDVLERLGPPPQNPLEMIRWTGRLVTETAWLEVRGLVDKGIAARIRATAGTVARVVPLDTIAEIERMLREDREETEADELGPKMEERSGVKSTAIRSQPR